MEKRTRFINRIFFIKILIPVIITLSLFVVSIFQIIIPRFEEIILDRKREMIRELTISVWHIAEHYYQAAAQGYMSNVEAQKWTIEQVRNLRYGEEQKDYFWITDFQPKMIMHPYREELNGKDLTNFTDSQDKKLFVEIVKVVNAYGEGYVGYTWQWKDDSTRIVPKLSYVKSFSPWGWIIGTGIYIEDVKVEIARLERNVINIAIWITITISILLLFITFQNLKSEKKRLQAENELRESKEKYQALVEVSTEGLLMVLEGKQTYFNKTLINMLGYTEEEVRMMNLRELFKTSLGDSINGADEPESLRRAINSHLETQLQRKDGALIDVLCSTFPISFYGKTGVVVIVKDISHHKKIADALEESKEKFKSLTNQLSLAVFRTNVGKEMKFLEVNPAAISIFGCKTMEELHNANLADLFEDSDAYKMMAKEISESGFVKNRIVRLKKKDNTSSVVTISIVLVKDEQGNPRYCDGIAEDITENKQIEKDKESLIAELQMPLLFLNQSIKPFVKEFTTCTMYEPIKKIARTMSNIKTEVMLVKDESGKLVGMITNDNLKEKYLIDDLTADELAYQYMKSPIVYVQSSSSIFDVLAHYNERDIKHFAVKDNLGVTCGVVSVNEIQKSQLNTYLFFLRNLQNSESVGEIYHYYSKLLIYIRMLIESGASVSNITRATSIISDIVTKKIISLAIEEIGPPPAKFAFLSLGSEGRAEQTLVTDQDNAILYENVTDEKANETHEYFSKLGERVCNALNSVGYVFCKGKVMAKNPKWCQPLSVWKQYFSDWVNTANPQDLLDVSIFFDFRNVYGEESLTEKLRNHLFDLLSGNNAFFVYLTQNTLRIKLPTGQIKAGEFFDSKLAMLPIIDLARIYALKNKVRDTNTVERFNRLHEKNVFSTAGYNDIIQAYYFIMQIRYRHQAKLLSENATPNNNIPVGTLTEIEKTIVRRVLALIEDFQTKLSLDFKGTM